MVVAGNEQCTLNFVFDGTGRLAGNVYLGVAAHCVHELGQTVSDGRGRAWGRVAFIGDSSHIPTDFAFIRVLSGFTQSVRASVVGHPGTPTGVASSRQAQLGDLVLLSGYGLIFRPTAFTRQQRDGVLLSAGGSEYQAEAPIFFGDSGGPVVLARGGGALGMVNDICAGTCGLLEGVTVQDILSKAAARGFPVRLRSAG